MAKLFTTSMNSLFFLLRLDLDFYMFCNGLSIFVIILNSSRLFYVHQRIMLNNELRVHHNLVLDGAEQVLVLPDRHRPDDDVVDVMTTAWDDVLAAVTGIHRDPTGDPWASILHATGRTP